MTIGNKINGDNENMTLSKSSVLSGVNIYECNNYYNYHFLITSLLGLSSNMGIIDNHRIFTRITPNVITYFKDIITTINIYITIDILIFKL